MFPKVFEPLKFNCICLLQAILNRERSEFSGQTELSLLCMTDTDIQTCVDVTEKVKIESCVWNAIAV